MFDYFLLVLFFLVEGIAKVVMALSVRPRARSICPTVPTM